MSTYVLEGTLATGIISGLGNWTDWTYRNYVLTTDSTRVNLAGLHSDSYVTTSITFDSTILSRLLSKTITSISLTLNLTSTSDSTFNLRYKCNSYVGGATNNLPWLVGDRPGGTATLTSSNPSSSLSLVTTFTPDNAETVISITPSNSYIPKWGFVVGWNKLETSSGLHYFTIGSAILNVVTEDENTIRVVNNSLLDTYSIYIVENNTLAPYRATIVNNSTLEPYS